MLKSKPVLMHTPAASNVCWDVEENKNQTLFRIMQTTFGQYASSPNYRIIANMPELRSRGIILIQHVKTNIIDAIMWICFKNLMLSELSQIKEYILCYFIFAKF